MSLELCAEQEKIDARIYCFVDYPSSSSTKEVVLLLVCAYGIELH